MHYDTPRWLAELTPAQAANVVLDSVVRLPAGCRPQQLLHRLDRPHPAYEKAKRITGHLPKQIPARLRGWWTEADWEGDERVVCARGIARDWVGGVDRTEAGEASTELLDAPEVSLRTYQRDAVEALLEHRHGLFVGPCGSGKTRVGIAALRARGRPALVLVHTTDLLRQWRERIEESLGFEAGQIGGGRKLRVGVVTVAMVQTLTRWSAWDCAALVRDHGIGVLVADEVHHQPAHSWRTTIDRLPCRWRWGLTATPEREDGLTPLMHWTMGPIVAQVHHDELLAGGVLVRPRIQAIKTGWQFPKWNPKRPNEMYAALVADERRNALVADLVAGDLAGGHVVLVLTGRKEHCSVLARLVGERGHEAQPLTSKVGKRAREAALDRLRSGELRCVVATQLADEGLDVPVLDRLVLAYPGRTKVRAIQRIGRAMRACDGKGDAVVFDLVDDVGVLQSQWASRRRAYRHVLGGKTTPA